MTPQEVLGLPPGACDPRALKKAYAAALKLHRPDRDPEGFARVRAAYEALQWAAEHGEAEENEDGQQADGPPVVVPPHVLEHLRALGHLPPTPQPAPAATAAAPDLPLSSTDTTPPAPPDVSPPVSTLPPAAPPPTLPDPLAALHALADTPGGADPETLASALRQAFAGLVAGTVTARAWDEAVAPFVPLRSQVVAETFTDDDLLDEAVHGSGIATATVIEHLFTFAGWERLGTLGQRWASHPPRCPPWLGQRIIHKLAIHLAVVDYRLANELVLAVGGARGLHFQDHGSLDRSLMLGSELKTAPLPVRHFVAELLAGGRAPASQPELLRALRKHLAPLPWSSATRQALGARYPACFRPPAAPVVTAGSSVTVFGVLVTLLFFIVATCLVGVTIALGHGSTLSAYSSLPIFGGAVWGAIVCYRRCRGWWDNRALPWLSAHLGPFDLRFWLLLLWWQAGPIPWLISACDIREWLWWGGIPLALPLLKLLRRGWRPAPSGWRRWLADPARAGETVVDLHQRQALDSLECTVLLIPLLLAGLAGGVVIVALVWMERQTFNTVATLSILPTFLIGIDASARVAVAQVDGWRETRTQWMVPLVALVLLAGVTGLVTWLIGKAI